jgi:hypothetical protein
MFMPLLLGCLTVFLSMAIQIAAVVFLINYLFNLQARPHAATVGLGRSAYVISMVMLIMFVGHLAQVAIWAALFLYIGEFNDVATAFYHSMVNFASLGYGDIVMSEQWRLLGAIEASNGVLMFGLTAGTLLSVMNFLLATFSPLKQRLESFK